MCLFNINDVSEAVQNHQFNENITLTPENSANFFWAKFVACPMGNCVTSQHWLPTMPTTIDPLIGRTFHVKVRAEMFSKLITSAINRTSQCIVFASQLDRGPSLCPLESPMVVVNVPVQTSAQVSYNC